MEILGCARQLLVRRVPHLWSTSATCLHTSTSLSKRRAYGQRVSHMQRYEWIYGVKKHKQRALFPFIPREAPTGLQINGRFVEFPEMRPEFVVPADLVTFELRPYVDWRADVIEQSEFSSRDLFDATYSPEITALHNKGKLDLDRVVEEYANKTITPSAK